MPAPNKTKKVQIPIAIFHKIISFMECCDTSGCDPNFKQLYRDIFSCLIEKRDSMELRESYAKVVFAEGEGQKKEALAAYLEQKELNQL
jgi:hypothetical protein